MLTTPIIIALYLATGRDLCPRWNRSAYGRAAWFGMWANECAVAIMALEDCETESDQ
jgi:hypothetical protein